MSGANNNHQVYYSKGFEKSISDTHSWRTVENSAKYVIPLIKPNFKILDVGCGPGSITIDFAKNYLSSPETNNNNGSGSGSGSGGGGSIIGIEPTQELIDIANENKSKLVPELTNISFQIGSIYELPFDDDSFDLVHAHQVIIHLQNPIEALKELKRVTKPGGFICIRDADLESSIVSPVEKYESLREFYVIKAKNAISTDTKAGRKLRNKALEAGYESKNLKTFSSSWLLADDLQIKKSWANATINRIKSDVEKLNVNDPMKNKQMNEKFIKLWQEWLEDETSLFTMIHFEIIYQKPTTTRQV